MYTTTLVENIEIKISEESEEFQWFDLQGLPENMLDSKEYIIKLRDLARKEF